MIDDSDPLSEMHEESALMAELAEMNSDDAGEPLLDCEVAESYPSLVSIIRKLRAAYDFAYRPGSERASSFRSDDLDEVRDVVRALPSMEIEGPSLPRTRLRQILWAAEGRAGILHLERFGVGASWAYWSDGLTLAMIAALGKVSQRYVQNAVSRGELRASTEGLRESFCDPREAYQWLIKRRGFVPWPTPDKRRRQLHRDLLQARSKYEFARIVDRIARDIDDDDDSAWDDPGALESVRSGRYCTDDVLPLRAVAAHLHAPDRAAFVGTAITLALRNVGE